MTKEQKKDLVTLNRLIKDMITLNPSLSVSQILKGLFGE